MQRARPGIALFVACYRVRTNGMGAAWWERTALPAAGGIAEQPAKDLMVLEHLEDIANELLQERLQASRARKRETESHG